MPRLVLVPPVEAQRHVPTRHGLVLALGLTPDTPLLSTFYSDYDRAFVLPNEKEELSGFVQCLALNVGDEYRRLSALYGDYREAVMLARRADTSETVGGANFIAARLATDLISINLNYIFVRPEQRRKGYLSKLVDGVVEAARVLLGASEPQQRALLFLEQNDPLRLSPQDYAMDSRHTGLDQVDRIGIWAKLGAKLIDFAYVQPALSSSQQPDHTLLYSVVGAEGDALDACVLRAHLQRFFGISVLKGRPAESSLEARTQLEGLAAQCAALRRIPLLEPTPVVRRLKQHGVLSLQEKGVTSLLDAVRSV